MPPWATTRRIIVFICTLILLLLGGGAGYLALRDDGAHVLPTHPSPQPSGARNFSATSGWPPANTRAGAEVRALNRAVAVAPVGTKPLLRGVTTGGVIRQNTRASCYLNGAGTQRVCTVTVRRGPRPWSQFFLNVVVATGQVVYHGYILYS